MGQVEDRWWSTASGSGCAANGSDGGCGGGPGTATAKIGSGPGSFARKPDAVRFLTLVQADLLRGSYIDPGRSRTPLSAYASTWLEPLSVRPTTRRTYDSHLRTWILPALGGRRLTSISPTDVRALVRQLTEHLAPSTARHVHGLLSTILRSAVEDGYLARNRAASTGPRRTPRPPVRPEGGLLDVATAGGHIQAPGRHLVAEYFAGAYSPVYSAFNLRQSPAAPRNCVSLTSR
jgi:hypothetical protein